MRFLPQKWSFKHPFVLHYLRLGCLFLNKTQTVKTSFKGLLVFQYAAAIWKREVPGNDIEKYAIS